jgi:hypothetical protein
MEKKTRDYLPSKKFIRFFGLVILSGILLWGASMVFGSKQVFQSEDEKVAVLLDETNFYQRDSDSDGVYDWEEGLWGLDPHDKDSDNDGISDGDKVEAEKAEIQHNNNFESETTDTGDLNQTEIFARQLFSAASLAKQQGGLQPDSLDAFSKSIDKSLTDTKIDDPFKLDNISLETISSADYKVSMSKAFESFTNEDIDEVNVIYRFANGDTSAGVEVQSMAERYNVLVRDLLAVKTPHTAAGIQLGLANNAAKLVISFLNIAELEEDPISAIIGFAQYEEYSLEFENSLKDLGKYFFINGII